MRMKIIQHHHVDGTLQRSIVEHNGVLCRRIAWWVTTEGELDWKPEPPVWQEKIHTGEFHHVSVLLAQRLEAQFVECLAAPKPGEVPEV